MFSEEISDSSASVSELLHPLQPEHLLVLGKQLQLPPFFTELHLPFATSNL